MLTKKQNSCRINTGRSFEMYVTHYLCAKQIIGLIYVAEEGG